MKKFTVNESANLKNFTDNVYPQGSFCFSRLLRDRDIRVNGKRTGRDMPLSVGDEVAYYTTPREENLPCYERVYEDENILIVDKVAGVNAEALFYTLAQTGDYYFIHRLDRNTAGLTAFAKNRSAERALLEAFAARKAVKVYRAICFNAFRKQSGVLEGYLKKDEKAAIVQIFVQMQRGAEPIRTEYRVLRGGAEYSLVEIVLHTGKTHQIRAHMASIGHPVAGDEKYGDCALNRKYGVRRQQLVAKFLRFEAKGALEYLRGKTFESRFEPQLKTTLPEARP